VYAFDGRESPEHAMARHRLMIPRTVSVLSIAIASSGWIHGSATPTYANWRQAVESVPCRDVKRLGDRLEIVGPLVIDGKSYQDLIIAGEDEIEAVEKRCSLKG
jgi:hypothetical protein